MALFPIQNHSDLDPVAEGIVAVHRVLVRLVPGDLRRVETPVALAEFEALVDRRIVLRGNPKIDVRPAEALRAAIGHFVDFAEHDELAGPRHRQRRLSLPRSLLAPYQ